MRPILTLLIALVTQGALAQLAPTGEFEYPNRMLPDPEGSYDAAIPTPEQTLGFRVGDRGAFPHEIIDVFEALALASPKAEIFEYARTYEGRPAVYMAISSAENMARLDDIRAGMARLADPRGLSDSDADALLADQVVTAWLGYAIHGDELSGADAAMLVAYHLIASQTAEVADWLDNTVILVDPLQNPDGRHRYLSMIEQHRGVAPNVDDQSLIHRGYWPWGRTNHYLFDMNRDWILGVSPEPRGRIVESRTWYPLLFVDAHEMGPQDTYLFSPDTEPLNDNFPAYLAPWQQTFGQDQAAAFDARGWTYYNGEWADNWYPGYGSSWSKIIGAVGILYEQASFDEDGIRRPEGTVITYHEAVHHQAVSSWANIRTLHENRETLLRGFLDDRRSVVSSSGPYANRSWVVLPTANRTRLAEFLDRMDLQGIEYHVVEGATSVGPGRDQLGRTFASRNVPAGSIVIPNRQPDARIAAAVLEFDPRLDEEILKKERTEVLKDGGGVMYDVTAWNLPMYFGIEALEVDDHLAPGSPVTLDEAINAASGPPAGSQAMVERSAVGYVVDGADDLSLAYAARLAERGVWARAAEKDMTIDSIDFVAGSIVVQWTDNRDNPELLEIVRLTAEELGLAVHSIASGQGDGDLPDLGGSHFKLLQKPQLALIARGGTNTYSFGSLWHAIDTKLAIRHSHLDADNIAARDLRRYNVIVLPDKSSPWDEALLDRLEDWVEDGGTLVAVRRSAFGLAKAKSDLTGVRLLEDVLGSLDRYEIAVHRDWQAEQRVIPNVGAVFSHVPATGDRYGLDPSFVRADSAELAEQDQWRRLFMPEGSPLLAGRALPGHWLSFGTDGSISVLFEGKDVLMAKPSVESVFRAGVFSPTEDGDTRERAGWSALPAGQELRLRQSGLLWPEASQRIANSSLVTRESKGKGQVILMAFEPNFRGTMYETARVFLNAIVLGPGFGTQTVVDP